MRSFPLLDIDHSYDDANPIPHEIFEEVSVKQIPKMCYCWTHSTLSKGLPTMR
jgi:hypothetical protein